MGLFDYVNFKTDCPNCGEPVTGFQTKDGDPYMAIVEPDTISYFYSGCDKCGAWIVYDKTPEPIISQRRETPLTESEVIELGFVRKVELK